MTADLPFDETIRIRPAAGRTTAKRAAISRISGELSGRVSHHYGPSVSITAVSPGASPPLAAAVAAQAATPADAVGQAGAAAFALRQSDAFRVAKANRPNNRVPWDHKGVPGLQAPLPPKLFSRPVGAPDDPTSSRLSGKVAVGVVIVSGPGALAFSAAEQTKVVAEVQHGLSWLGAQSRNGTAFYYDVQKVALDLVDDPDGADKEGYWRDPTMAALGYPSVLDYVRHLRTQLGTDWAYCAFFVKYSQSHFAYAFIGGPYLCMQYANDGWGPDNIDRVLAHETGHIFNAPDEYTASGCNCVSTYGMYNIANGNCEPCAQGGGVSCLMRANDWTMCTYTPWHLGCPSYFQGDPGGGIGGYDLKSGADRAFALDYTSSGKMDYLALYRPGAGTIWIQKNNPGTGFAPVYQQGDPGSGIGGYDLASPSDRAFAFDYDGSGKRDHLVLYRPGTGTIWILQNVTGVFTPVYQQGDPGSGIGGYDLASPNDRVCCFDYDSSGHLDHLVLYRPGTGTIWILRNVNGAFTPVYQQGDPGSGIGGYDLASGADRVFPFDYSGSGKLDHLALYRPGTGTIWILQNVNGVFTPVYQQGDPGSGIGGYDLASPADRVFPFDYTGTKKLDHLALYRPGTGTIWILQNVGGVFSPVYAQGDPGSGLGGYDLKSPADRVCSFDYVGAGTLSSLVLYRPGAGAIAVIPSGPGFGT